jgi:hypothetical protein
LPRLEPRATQALEPLPDLDLEPLVRRLVVDVPGQGIRQVLLIDIGVVEVVRIEVALAVALLPGETPMGRRPQMERNRQPTLLLDVGERGEVRAAGSIRLGSRCDIRGSLR